MSDEVFRWVITIGVAGSWLMIIIMTGAVLGMYRAFKRLEGKVHPLIEKAGPILDSARAIMDDAKPRIQAIIAKGEEITVSARNQMARIEAVVGETADTVKIQLERIDRVVGDTANRVQETTSAVQRTVLKPVREVNGVVSGLRAAISTLGRGNRASVDHATQDEEMFI